MKEKINPSTFDYDFTGSKETEQSLIQKGYSPILGKDLQERIVNKTIFGDYLMGYKFITDIYENGKTEGINHVGSYNLGHWTIDMKANTMSTQWNNGWFETLTRAYEVNGNIEFFDIDTGLWRTTFKVFKSWA